MLVERSSEVKGQSGGEYYGIPFQESAALTVSCQWELAVDAILFDFHHNILRVLFVEFLHTCIN